MPKTRFVDSTRAAEMLGLSRPAVDKMMLTGRLEYETLERAGGRSARLIPVAAVYAEMERRGIAPSDKE